MKNTIQEGNQYMPELIKNTIVFLSAHPILLIVFGYFCLNFKECNWNTPSVFQNDAIQVHTMATTLLIICASIFSWGGRQSVGHFYVWFNGLANAMEHSGVNVKSGVWLH